MQQTPSTLDVIYENWGLHNRNLVECVTRLTAEQLRLQPGRGMWPLGQILQHIVAVRAGWFSGTLQEEDRAMREYMEWAQPESPERTGAELARGLNETWDFMRERLQRWSPADLAKTFPDEVDGQPVQVPRSWVIYHVMEHDLHHGGEVSLILGMSGFPVSLV